MIEVLGFCAATVIAFGVFVVMSVAMWWDAAGREWHARRALEKMARTYGIEVVPGEDTDNLRRMIIARRDKLMGPP